MLRIIGIGASAGGLDALEMFFGSVPAESGCAFVVVQHLDPTFDGMLAELLQRFSALPVTEIEDGTVVEPDHVYVIPRDRDITIEAGILHLHESAPRAGPRLTIDLFFRSLARERGEHAVGVVLSGMASDGTAGLRVIREHGGLTFVQEPSTAKYDAMPRSAIAAELADVVAPPEELFDRIRDFSSSTRDDHRADHQDDHRDDHRDDPQDDHQADHRVDHDEDGVPLDDVGLEPILSVIQAQTGHDFLQYKRSTLSRRVRRRMRLHHLGSLDEYERFLEENPNETDLLFHELLIGVTSFFRDSLVWERVAEEVLPALLASRPSGITLRAWVAGCSTGEEAYSLAMVFKETVERLHLTAWIEIFATDLDPAAIEKARLGRYGSTITDDVSPERLSRFFVEEKTGYRIKKEIRDLVVFAPQNLVMDPPFTRLDILSCRNLLIYIAPELQRRLLPLFHYSLRPGGFLLLGSAETIGPATDLFAPLEGRVPIYRRLERTDRLDVRQLPAVFSPRSAAAPPATLPTRSQQSEVDRLLLQRFSPAAVLVGAEGDILYISGKTGKYLEPAVGRANWNLFAMARGSLAGPITDGFRRAIREKSVVVVEGTVDDETAQRVRVTFQPLTDGDLVGSVLVVFSDVILVPARLEAPVGEGGLVSLEKLHEAREELRIARVEMQMSRGELQSAIQELQATNEELQSTNEELTSSKEELQSMNEELQTVNHELEAKLSELALAGSDMANLLDSTRIATLFLDAELRVRRFTSQAAELISLIATDVGRPVTDLSTILDYASLADDAREVLQSLVTVEKQIATRDGRWYSVRIMPYRTHDGGVDGLVLTFNETTEARSLEATLHDALGALEETPDPRTLQTLRERLTRAVDARRAQGNGKGGANRGKS